MRPIPDGGLKEAMPSWLKRPPAWRSIPTAEDRFERSLPPPDSSTIDPKSLVDIADLPQWLQQVMDRGTALTVPVDESVSHAVDVIYDVNTEPTSAVEIAPVDADDNPAEVQEALPAIHVETGSAVPAIVPIRQSTKVLWSIIAALIVLVLVLGIMQFI